MMNWKKMFAIGLLCIGAVGMMTGCGGDQKKGANGANGKPEKIIAGMDDTFAPMGFRDDAGNIVGFDVDIAKAISKEIGVTIEFKPIDWAGKETELSSGRIDCIWNGFSITPEREKVLIFSKPYMANAQVYVVRADSDIQSVEDLKGRKLSIQESSTAQFELDKNEALKKSFESIKAYPDFSSCFMDLESGRCDAILGDTCLIEYYMTKKAGMFRELPGVLSKDSFAIGIKKDNAALQQLLNEGIDKIIASGEAAKISEKWFGKDVILK